MKQSELTKERPKWVLLPDSLFRKIWVQLQLVIALYIIWVTPIRVVGLSF